MATKMWISNANKLPRGTGPVDHPEQVVRWRVAQTAGFLLVVFFLTWMVDR